jgi:HEAT repeat protein
VVPTLRILAALGKTAQPAAVSVEALLSAKEPEVVLESVRTLGAMGETASAAKVLSVYQAEWKQLAACREDWVRSDPPTTLEPAFDMQPPDPRAGKLADLMDRVRQQNDARRQEAGLPPASVPEVVEDCELLRTQLAAAALQSLAELGSPEAPALVRRHLRDSAPGLAQAALLGAAYGGKEGWSLLASSLASASPEQRDAVAEALVDQGEAGRQGLLDLAGAAAGSGPVQPFLSALIQEGPPPDGVPALEALLRRGGPEAAAAAHLLGQLRATSSVPLLLAALQDPSSPAHRDALWALGQIGSREATSAVGKELFHESPEVRAAAAQALSRIENQEQRSVLTALTHDYFLAVREQAKAALAAQTVVSRP